jgi:hypothetical protein
MKEIIPTLGEKIIIEMIESNIRTDFYLFSIRVQGIGAIELRLTGETINMINDSVNKQIKDAQPKV